MPSDKPSASQHPGILTLAVLSAIPFIMVLGNSMIIPVLPTASRELGVSSFQVSLLITLFSVPAAMVIPVAGILADRIGRKKVIVTGLILYGLGGLLAGFASVIGGGSYGFLLASRIIQGIGAAGTAPIAMVLVGDLFQGSSRSKSLGIIEASNAMGKVLSPVLGSLIAMITWYAMFFAFPLLCVPVALALWKWIREPAAKQEPAPLSEYRKKISMVFKRQGRWLNTAFFAGAVTMFSMFGVLFFLSEFLEKTYRMDGIRKGLLLAVPLLALCAVAYITGSKVRQQTGLMKKLILIGMALMTLAITVPPWIDGMWWLMTDTFFIGIGAGLILPCLNTLITSAVGLRERGIITSLYGSVRFFGVALGPPVYGALADSPYLLFMGNAGLLALALILSALLIRRPMRLKGKGDRSRLLLRKRRLNPA
ncbi:MFS transporter [Staphylospora marina]|uniref:MFS transporter n=1 Tax=Staphylospora marina TaxID=2490858 RepID=UPI000F5C20B0|nr:MFS transporter [Staphylospora marina]